MSKIICTALSTDAGPHTEMLTKAGFEVVDAPRNVDLYQPANLLPIVRDCVAVVRALAADVPPPFHRHHPLSPTSAVPTGRATESRHQHHSSSRNDRRSHNM